MEASCLEEDMQIDILFKLGRLGYDRYNIWGNGKENWIGMDIFERTLTIFPKKSRVKEGKKAEAG